MKLAEALMERADLNRKISELEMRIRSNVNVQEGEEPLEDPNELLETLNSCIARLVFLMERINLTNCSTRVDGKTLTEWIAKKDGLQVQFNTYQNIIHAASQTTDRARGSEIRILATVKVADLQKESDEMAKEIRAIDNLLQQTNWTVDLAE